MKKIRTIDDVLRYINSIPNINLGGCGIAALAIYRWYRRNRRVDVKVHYIYSKFSMSYPTNESIKRNNSKDKPRAASHVLIEINGVIMDSDGVTTINSIMEQNGYIYHHVFDVKFLVKSINNLPAWSDVFDRRIVPTMAKRLGIKLNDVRI